MPYRACGAEVIGTVVGQMRCSAPTQLSFAGSLMQGNGERCGRSGTCMWLGCSALQRESKQAVPLNLRVRPSV